MLSRPNVDRFLLFLSAEMINGIAGLEFHAELITQGAAAFGGLSRPLPMGRFPAKLLPDGAGPFSPVRRLFLEHLKQAHDLDQLRFFGNIADLASPVALNRTLGTKHILRRQRFGYARRQEQLGAGKFKPIKSRSPQARYNVTFSMKDMLSRRFASKFGSPCTDAAKGSYEKLPA